MMKLTAFLLALCGLVTTHAFVPQSVAHRHHGQVETALNMNKLEKGLATVALTAALLVGTTNFDAQAATPGADFVDSSPQVVLAARSGGRAGGRASYSRGPSRSYSAPRTSYSRSTTIVRPMIASPPIMVSPFGGGFGYGYNPMGGFGLGYGLGAVNSAGNGIREYRQEAEIGDTQAELAKAKARETELEARIQALEKGQTLQQVPQAAQQAAPATGVAPVQQ